jgi:uncharacterized protein (TIGR03435 family)
MKLMCAAGFVATLLALPGIGLAQAPAASVAFEVASVKESSSVEIDGLFRRQPGRFIVTNLPVRSIIQYAYRIREYQLIDAPTWTARSYDINATIGNPSASDDDVRLMLQQLLADRFSLRIHRDQRDLPMYALVPARGDGRLGSQLVRADVDCDKLAAERASQPAGARGPNQPRSCAMFANAWLVRGFSQTMPQLAQVLETILRTRVVDRTGLTGRFNIDVQWAPKGSPGTEPGNGSVEDRAAMFTAFPEQLGLKIEPVRGRVDVVIVDSVQRPTPD